MGEEKRRGEKVGGRIEREDLVNSTVCITLVHFADM